MKKYLMLSIALASVSLVGCAGLKSGVATARITVNKAFDVVDKVVDTVDKTASTVVGGAKEATAPVVNASATP